MIIFFMSCSSHKISNEEQIQINYDQGIEYYNKKKYSKAKESFQYVMLHSAGSRLALESEFYLSESLYNLGLYEEALYGYDNYARSSQNLDLIELSRFRLCESVYNLTLDYKKDQESTMDALEKIEIFLEDYPQSEYHFEALLIKSELKYRLAKKEYESAILYIKLQEYKASLIYLIELINNYFPLEPTFLTNQQPNQYDIYLKELLDDARIMIVYAYLLDNRKGMAIDFYNLQDNNFYNSKSKDKIKQLLESDGLSKFNTWKDVYLGISK